MLTSNHRSANAAGVDEDGLSDDFILPDLEQLGMQNISCGAGDGLVAAASGPSYIDPMIHVSTGFKPS